MDDFNSVYMLLGIVILIVLLCRFDGRFTKVEKELNAIKKQMDDLLKGQAKLASGNLKSSGKVSEKVTEEVAAEVLRKEKLVEEEPVVPKQSIVMETVAAEHSQDIQEEIVEKILVGDIRKEENVQKNESTEKEVVIPSVAVASVTPVISVTPVTPSTSVTPGIPSTPKPQPQPKKQVNYEKFIGENLFGKIGILIFVIGVGFFVKYAIDKNWSSDYERFT